MLEHNVYHVGDASKAHSGQEIDLPGEGNKHSTPFQIDLPGEGAPHHGKTDGTGSSHDHEGAKEGKGVQVGDPGLEKVHTDTQARKAEIDKQIQTLSEKIQQETEELKKPPAAEPEPKDSLEGFQRYCRNVGEAIGKFFQALMGQEAKVEQNPKTIKLAQDIGIDVAKLKGLQQTGEALQQTDRQIEGLKNKATEKQIQGLNDDIKKSKIEEQMSEAINAQLLDALLKQKEPPQGTTPGGDARPPDPDRGTGGTEPHDKPPATGNETRDTPVNPQNQDGRETLPPVEPPHADMPPTVPHPEPPEKREQPPVPPEHADPNEQKGTNPLSEPPKPPVETEKPREPGVNPPEADGTRIIGDRNWEQEGRDYVHSQAGLNEFGDRGTCGITTQEMVLNRLEGHNPDGSLKYNERDLVHDAAEHGWFQPGGGTVLAEVGNLIEAKGYPVERKDSSLEDLTARLAHGDQVIVGVNAAKLGDNWKDDPTAYGDGSANHVVWVSGVRVEEHNGVREVVGVFVHDSGCGKSYELPAEQFKQAWQPSNNYAVYVSPKGGQPN